LTGSVIAHNDSKRKPIPPLYKRLLDDVAVGLARADFHLDVEIDVRERLDSAARDILNTAQQMAQAADVVNNQVMLVGNHPAELIIQAAKSNDCDLIFMASHGRSGVTALLLGSETHKVLTHSKIPVLVYR
jgi:nucleotide-binding universal stress UspA family protein